MDLELNDVQTEVLTRELHSIIQNDRYPLSPRIVALKGDPWAVTAGAHTRAAAPRRHYELPSKGRYARRRG